MKYLTAIIGGTGDFYISAEGIARWCQRNLRVFANAYDIADFFTDSPELEYIEVNEYLKK